MKKKEIIGCLPRTTFYENQISKGLCLDTVRQQEKIALAFENWCKIQQINPKKASYNDVLEYVNHLQSIKNMPATIRTKLNTLAHYFDYLDVKINVARLIKLKGGIRTRLYLALETQELNACSPRYVPSDLLAIFSNVNFLQYQASNALLILSSLILIPIPFVFCIRYKRH